MRTLAAAAAILLLGGIAAAQSGRLPETNATIPPPNPAWGFDTVSRHGVPCDADHEGQSWLATGLASVWRLATGGSETGVFKCRQDQWGAELGPIEQLVHPFNRVWVVNNNPVFSQTVFPASWNAGACTPGPPNPNDPDVSTTACPAGIALCATISVGQCAGGGGGNGVQVYMMGTNDADLQAGGVSWSILNSGNPIVEPGIEDDFDEFGVETPSVVKVGSTYHMYATYYSDCTEDGGGNLSCSPIYFGIEHRTSTTGLSYLNSTKSVMAISSVVGKSTVGQRCQDTGNAKGCNGVAEPNAIYNPDDATNPIWVYFSRVYCRDASCNPAIAYPPGKREIALIRCQTDGVTCTAPVTVLEQGTLFDARFGWDGPGQNSVYRDAGGWVFAASMRKQMPDGNDSWLIFEWRGTDGLTWKPEGVVGWRGMRPNFAHSIRSQSFALYGGQLAGIVCGDSFMGVGTLGTDFVSECVMLRRFRN